MPPTRGASPSSKGTALGPSRRARSSRPPRWPTAPPTAADRAADRAALDNPYGVARLLDSLRRAQAQDQVTKLADRAAALDNPAGVAFLLASLRKTGAEQQAAALLARDPAAHAALDNPPSVASLLASLREAGAEQQAAALADRLPAAGMFELFREQECRHKRAARIGSGSAGRLTAAQLSHGDRKIWTDAAGLSST